MKQEDSVVKLGISVVYGGEDVNHLVMVAALGKGIKTGKFQRLFIFPVKGTCGSWPLHVAVSSIAGILFQLMSAPAFKKALPNPESTNEIIGSH